MATVKIILDTRFEKKGGLYPIKLVVNHKATSYVGLGISVTLDQWTGKEVIYSPKSKLFNNELKSKLVRAENMLIHLTTTGAIKNLSQKELLRFIELNNTEPEPKQEYKVETHFKKYITQCRATRTAELYENTLKQVLSLSLQLTFNQLDTQWLKSFVLERSKTCEINTIAIDLRNIRAIFNDAINEEFVSQSLYPFRKFKIKKEKTIKRNLTVEKLIQLRDHPVKRHLCKYIDIFMLQFYLIGISIVDLLYLENKNFVDGRIEYKRHKTGIKYSVYVLPEAMEIINKYAGKEYVLAYMDTHKNYKAFSARLNKNLKLIGTTTVDKGRKVFTPLIPKLTTYYSRHSWATLASSIDIPIETISASLGHEYGSETTAGYINFDQGKIDKANKQVVGLLDSKL